MARITVKVHPRARRTAVTGRQGGAWKLDLAAPPTDGKANNACIKFLAELMGVAQTRVRVLFGLTSRMKVVEIEGVSQQSAESKLGT